MGNRIDPDFALQSMGIVRWRLRPEPGQEPPPAAAPPSKLPIKVRCQPNRKRGQRKLPIKVRHLPNRKRGQSQPPLRPQRKLPIKVRHLPNRRRSQSRPQLSPQRKLPIKCAAPAKPEVQPEPAAAKQTPKQAPKQRPAPATGAVAAVTLKLHMYRQDSCTLLCPATDNSRETGRMLRGIVRSLATGPVQIQSGLLQVRAKDDSSLPMGIAQLLGSMFEGAPDLRLILLGEVLSDALAAQPLPEQAKVLCAPRVQELAASVEERQKLWQQMRKQLL